MATAACARDQRRDVVGGTGDVCIIGAGYTGLSSALFLFGLA